MAFILLRREDREKDLMDNNIENKQKALSLYITDLISPVSFLVEVSGWIKLD